jgi:putative transposase
MLRRVARLPRFFVPDMPLHVVQRGNNRGAIFASPDDFAFFHGCLVHAMRLYRASVHAYVLMTNHLHLVVTPSAASCIPKLMQSVGRVYVAYFNGRYARTGTLWEGRYKAAIIQDERYLLSCMRYVELNPVRAAMVVSPADYQWSSFRANALGRVDHLVTPHPLYERLAGRGRERQQAYCGLFDSLLDGETISAIRDATQYAWALGDDRFQAQVSALARRAARVRTGPRSADSVTLDVSRSRKAKAARHSRLGY